MSQAQESLGSKVLPGVIGAVAAAALMFASGSFVTKIDAANTATKLLEDGDKLDILVEKLGKNLGKNTDLLNALAADILRNGERRGMLLDAMHERDPNFRGFDGVGCEIGSIHPWPGERPPESGFWMFCNGAEVSREECSDLFEVIGVLYGRGDEKTTFNLPDYRGYFLRGAGGVMTRKSPSEEPAWDERHASSKLGEPQQDSIERHQHAGVVRKADSHAGGDNIAGVEGVVERRFSRGATGDNRYEVTDFYPDTQEQGETRPINKAVNYIIRVR